MYKARGSDPSNIRFFPWNKVGVTWVLSPYYYSNLKKLGSYEL